MEWKSICIGAAFMVAAQITTWFQLNSQFVWTWAKDHPWTLIVWPSIPISIFYYFSTKYMVGGFGGVLWPARFLSFGIGVIIFATLVYFLKGEGLNAKTIVSLTLALALMAVQVFWK